MNRTDNPWTQIQVPRNDYNVRRVPDSGRVPMFWGRDIAGRFLLLIELDGDFSDQFDKVLTSVRGIEIDLRRFGRSSEQGLVITLDQQVNCDLFLGLCNTMIESLKPVETSGAALSVALAHIKRWKTFLAGRKGRLLTHEEVRGLFGELLFLKHLYSTDFNIQESVDAWVGPDGAHQDFQIRDIAVEVKSLSGRERNSVRISSEDQLEVVTAELYLVLYGLRELPDSEQAKSLNELVREMTADLAQPELIDLFEQRLAAVGYVEMRDYDAPKFVITSKRTFRVDKAFPRLVRSEIPDGIRRVHYELELEKLEPFECEVLDLGGR